MPAQFLQIRVGRRAARLGREVEGACLERPHRHVGAAAREGAYHDGADFRRRHPRGVKPLNRFERLEAIEAGHFHVQRNDVHLGRVQELKRFLAAEDGADDNDSFLTRQRLGKRGAKIRESSTISTRAGFGMGSNLNAKHANQSLQLGGDGGQTFGRGVTCSRWPCCRALPG